jgi:hypothetical protein
LVLSQDDHHALLILRFVEVLEQVVVISVDGEHGEAEHLFARGLAVAAPQPGDPHRLAVLALNAGGHRVAASPVWLIDDLREHDQVV